MQRLVLLSLLPTLSVAAAPTAEGSTAADPPGNRPLRPMSDCLDPSRVRGYRVLDSSRLLVDAGRRRYLLTLSWSCNELGTHRALAFESRNPSGRICGDLGDAVRPREGGGTVLTRCEIGRVELIDQATWDAELRAR